MALTIRAICPACERRLARRHYWFHFRRERCEHCLVGLRSNQVRENWQSVPLAIILLPSVFLAFVGVVPWWNPALVVVLIVLLGWVTFPYLTTYDRLTEGPQCVHCGYDLKGAVSSVCPECGDEHDSHAAAI